MADASMIWNCNWAWSLPLIVLTVILHVICLGVINTWVVRALHPVRGAPPLHHGVHAS